MSQTKKVNKQVKKIAPKKTKVYRPKGVLPDGQKKQLIEATERHNSIEPASQGTDGMTLPALVQESSLQQVFQVTASYLFAFGSILNREETTGMPSADAFPSIAYLLEGIVRYATGSIDVERMPKIHAILSAMLRQRTLRFRYGNVVYTPTISMPNFNSTMTLADGDIWFNIPPDSSTNTVLTSPGTAIFPSSDAYTNTLSCYTRAECPLSRVVDLTSIENKYRYDPSCYARTYAYFGGNGVLGGGLVNDAELEVPFRMPSFSKYIVYDDSDTQIARILKLQSGGPAMNFAFALTDKQFTEDNFKNVIPTIYKFLDLTELYLYAATWLARAYGSIVTPSLTGQNLPQTLPFSKYDFFVILRQAVLSQFTASQLQGQFCQPIAATSSGSLFKPLVMDPATIPTPTYAGLYLPSLLVENISMLKQASYCSPHKVGKNKDKPSPLRVTYVPVWGVYTEDELPDVVIPYSEGSVPLFSDVNQIGTYRSITDLSMSNINQKVNPNSQVAINCLQTWNSQVQNINNTTQVGTISSDVNYTGNLLIYTRIQEPADPNLQLPLKVQDPSTQYIKGTITTPGPKGKPTVKVIQTANLYTRTILSVKTIPQELNNNLFNLIIPSLRLDNVSTEDKLTQVAWQTYTGEVASQPFDLGPVKGGVSMTSRAYSAVGHCITGAFAPSNEQDTLQIAMQQLGKHSWGADLFGQIASGLLGMIPVVGPALSQVASSFF